MGTFSEVIVSRRFPLGIEIFPCLRDHCFEGRAVYPAVEAMQLLAASTPAFLSEIKAALSADFAVFLRNLRTDCIENARFDRFLVIPPDAERISAFNEIEVQSDGCVRASLLTHFQSRKGAMKRMVTHASLCFKEGGTGDELKRDAGEAPILETPEDAFIIPADRLYKELVPFAPAYRNIVGHAWLTPKSGGALVLAAEHETGPGPLGSPFPLDAAFHVACAWSQRYAGTVAFPVGLERRRIFVPIQKGEQYRASILPLPSEGAFLFFDIELFAMDGTLCERAAGVRMRDVSGGRVRPPGWVHLNMINAVSSKQFSLSPLRGEGEKR